MAKHSIRKYPHSKNNNPYFTTFCRDCGKAELRRSDAIKKWLGRCRKCASKVTNNRSNVMAQRVSNRVATIRQWSAEQKAALAERARQQVLRQGGVPNAKKFVKEGEQGRRMAGPNHYAWRGGISREARNGRQAAEWRKAVFQRDNFTCQLCGIRGVPLHADHILPWATHEELRFELSNGRTLCVPCHKTTPTYGWHGRKLSEGVKSMQTIVLEN